MKTKKKSAPLSGNKLYLLLLLLFCFCLNAGLLTLRAVEYRRQYNAKVEEFERYFHALLESYAPDELLMVSTDYTILVSLNGEISSDPEGFGAFPEIEDNTVVRRNGENGRPYLVAILNVSKVETHNIVCCLIRDLSDFDHEQEAQNLVTVVVSFIFTALLIGGFALITKRSTLWQAAPADDSSADDTPDDVPNPAPIHKTDLSRLAASLLNDLAEEAEARGIYLGGSALPHSLVAHDEQLLSPLLASLLRTVMTATPENGRVMLTVFRRDTLMLTISTSGSLSETAVLSHRPATEAAGVTLTHDDTALTLGFVTASDTDAV